MRCSLASDLLRAFGASHMHGWLMLAAPAVPLQDVMHENLIGHGSKCVDFLHSSLVCGRTRCSSPSWSSLSQAALCSLRVFEMSC